jgi:hypothetical protein
MTRRIFHSFRFDHDYWRVQNLRNIGAVGNAQRLLSPNKWEDVQQKGKKGIKDWIDGEMAGKTCVVVLIGSATAGREWVDYEISKGWNDGKGVVGVHIHGLKDNKQQQASKGRNPLSAISLGTGSSTKKLSAVAKTYDPPYVRSDTVYRHIAANIEDWIEEAIEIRNAY